MRSRPLSTSMRRTTTFFNVLSPPLPDPPARGGLPWVAVGNSGDDPRGVDSATPSPSLLPDAPGANGGGNSGGTSPSAPPLGRHQGPDPRAGRRVSIRPQPTRAPRPEAMALGPLWGRGAARAVARVPTRQWGVGGTAGGTTATALRLPLPPGAADVAAGGLPLPPAPPPPPGRAGAWGVARGRALPVGGPAAAWARQLPAPRGLCPDMLTPEPTAAVRRAEAPCPQEAACPPRLTKASEHAKAGRAPAIQIALVPFWTRPARVVVGTAAVQAPATPLLEWPQCPDPRPGWRVSIRPQPTRAPQGEAMALGPPRGRGPARAVARGPTLPWGVGSTAGGAAAAALRLLLAPGVTRTVAGAPPPPPVRPSPSPHPPPRGTADANEPNGQRGLPTQRFRGAGNARCPPPPPTLPAPSGQAWPPVDLQLHYFSYGTWTTRTWTLARPRARARTRGPGPPCTPHGTPAAAPRPRPGSLVVPPGRHGVPAPPPALHLGPHGLRPSPPRRPPPQGLASPGPAGRGLEQMVAQRAPARGRGGMDHRSQSPEWPRVRDQGGHCGPSPTVEVPPGPLRARPPAGSSRRPPPVYVAQVPLPHVAGGNGRAAAAPDRAPARGAVG